MFEIIVIIIGVITLILLKFFLTISFKKMKELDLTASEEVKEIANRFPKDEQICRDILKKLNHTGKEVKIKEEPQYTSCLYTVFNNTITIGKFQQDYMKIQTLAHECIHACQSKRTLWSNFIITNLYLLYFITILILTFLNKIPDTTVQLFILFAFGMIQYIVRFSLENEAMIRARYVAKEYIEENKLLTKQEEFKLLEAYDKVNEIGIPFMNYDLISMNILKLIFYALVSLI